MRPVYDQIEKKRNNKTDMNEKRFFKDSKTINYNLSCDTNNN